VSRPPVPPDRRIPPGRRFEYPRQHDPYRRHNRCPGHPRHDPRARGLREGAARGAGHRGTTAGGAFGANPALFGLVAEDDSTGEPVGFALWFLNFSTWRGPHGIYLEDLYVSPASRGGGHGKALLLELARIAVERGYSRMEWSVLDWNEPSINFYKSLGAVPMDGWTTYRLTDGALAEAGRR